MVMDRDGQPLGPSGRLANRIRDQVAAAKELLRQSNQVAERAGARVRQSQLRLEQADLRALRAGDVPLTPLADRVLEVKQRELTAHRGAIELHEQAAQLQERLGHPDRAAQARQHAAHARELYRQAWDELADYQSRRGSGRPWPAAGGGW
jgi:hypothetical protein